MSVKERILQIIEYQNITKEKFFSDIGYSGGNFRGENLKKQIGSDVLVTIVTKFNIDAHWLLTGEGEMYRNNNKAHDPTEIYGSHHMTDRMLIESNLAKAEKLIAFLEKENARLERENDILRKKIPKDDREKQPRAGRAS